MGRGWVAVGSTQGSRTLALRMGVVDLDLTFCNYYSKGLLGFAYGSLTEFFSSYRNVSSIAPILV
jgi:hypothetical protein